MEKSPVTDYGCSSFETIISFPSSDVLAESGVREKAVNLNLSIFTTPKRKNPRDSVPLNA